MFFGLSFAGFGEERQRVRESLNVDRFKAHFGPEPRTVKDILYDLKESLGSSIIYKDVMMAMNWLKLCKYRGRLSRCCAMVNFRGSSPPPPADSAAHWEASCPAGPSPAPPSKGYTSIDTCFSLLSISIDDMEHVLAGRWKYGEDYIRRAVRENAASIQSLKPRVIRFAGYLQITCL